jgi:hypothetical protein
MKLFQLFERTIKIPKEFVEDVYRMCIYSIYRYNTRGGNETDINSLSAAIEDVTELDMNALSMEFEGRFKKSISALGDFSGLTAVNVKDIPYYHSSELIKKRLDSLNDDDIAVLVFIKVREIDNSAYYPHNNSLKINVFELSSAILSYWFNDEDAMYKKDVLKHINTLKKTIDHEVQHLIQDVALPPEQSSIKKNYNAGTRTQGGVHNDYYTSQAENRPQLATMESNFRNAIADDEYWELFTPHQRKELFKMYVGMEAEPFEVDIGGVKARISIPPKEYFKALKQDSPKQYIKAVKDFYTMIKDLF